MHQNILAIAIVILSSLLTSTSRAQLKVANVFSDNMVLQREQPVNIWGTANAGQPVSIKFSNGSSSVTNADERGRWQMQLPSLPAMKTPLEIKIDCGDDSITFTNVLVGDVWICSGQSNMEWKVDDAGNPDEERAHGNHPMIRHVKVLNQTSLILNDDAANTGWQVCTPETVGEFTAVGYYFGRELYRDLDVPIGLLNTSWGGTIIEAWISGASLKKHPDFADIIATMEAVEHDESAIREATLRAQKWNTDFAAALSDRSDQWNAPELDDSQWTEQTVPGHWEQQGHPDLDGVAWYRRQFDVPADWAGREMTISLAKIDDSDETYLNGKQIGGKNSWNDSRVYTVPAELVKAGSQAVSIRVVDTGGGGGIHGSADGMFAGVTGSEPISLAGKWKFKIGSKTAALSTRPKSDFAGPNHPTLLYNAMVHPLHPIGFKGAIWYQGESNADRAFQYRSLMPLLISDWRSKWSTPEKRSEFPFYWVQLANFTAPSAEPGPSEWAELREAQSMTLSVKNTGQAVIIDIGEAYDIHPKNKQEVGRRLALLALAKDYSRDVEFSGPVFQSMQNEGKQIRLKFDHADGLRSSNGPLQRFEIAGDDQKYVWADAQVSGSDVVVSSSAIENPVAVRYAWANNPAGCNLVNGAGLPASPFRTDNWKGVTEAAPEIE